MYELYNFASGQIIALSVVGSVSFALTFWVTVRLIQFGMRSISSWLLFYLNCILLLNEIVSLPVYTSIPGLCSFMAFIKAYADFSNVLVALSITLSTYNLLFEVSMERSRFTLIKRWHATIILLPVVSFLPALWANLTGQTVFGQWNSSPWCSFTNTFDGDISFYVFMSVLMIMIALNILLLFAILIKIKCEHEIVKKVFLGDGLYSIITLICWFPKLGTLNLTGVNGVNQYFLFFFARLFTYISGVLYGITFFFGSQALKDFEQFLQNDSRLSSISEVSVRDSDGDFSTVSAMQQLPVIRNDSNVLNGTHSVFLTQDSISASSPIRGLQLQSPFRVTETSTDRSV